MDPLEKFLYQYKVQKGDGKRFTHTRIGGKKEDGHYHLKDTMGKIWFIDKNNLSKI